MAVMLLDMALPNSCAECRFRMDGWCYAIPEFCTQPGPLQLDARPEWCKLKDLKEIPDAIMEDAQKRYAFGFGDVWVKREIKAMREVVALIQKKFIGGCNEDENR